MDGWMCGWVQVVIADESHFIRKSDRGAAHKRIQVVNKRAQHNTPDRHSRILPPCVCLCMSVWVQLKPILKKAARCILLSGPPALSSPDKLFAQIDAVLFPTTPTNMEQKVTVTHTAHHTTHPHTHPSVCVCVQVDNWDEWRFWSRYCLMERLGHRRPDENGNWRQEEYCEGAKHTHELRAWLDDQVCGCVGGWVRTSTAVLHVRSLSLCVCVVLCV